MCVVEEMCITGWTLNARLILVIQFSSCRNNSIHYYRLGNRMRGLNCYWSIEIRREDDSLFYVIIIANPTYINYMMY